MPVHTYSREKYRHRIVFANNFALSDAEDKTYGPLNRGGIANLPLLRTLLAICQKSQEPSFWKVMETLGTKISESFSTAGRL